MNWLSRTIDKNLDLKHLCLSKYGYPFMKELEYLDVSAYYIDYGPWSDNASKLREVKTHYKLWQ